MSALGLAAVLYAAVLPTSVNSGARVETRRIAILPFEDRSGFRGKWELDREIPALWGQILAQDSSFVIIPFDSVEVLIGEKRAETLDARRVSQIGRALNAGFLVAGTVEDYNLSRLSVGDLNLGGYKSYSASVKLGDVRAFRASDGVGLGRIGSEKKVTDRELGLDLFGPRERDREFFHLDAIVFGSDRFRNTVIGAVTVQVLEELTEKLKGLIALPPLPPDLAPALLSVQGETGYIDVGSRDGVVVGHTFEVYAPEEHTDTDTIVGKVRVTTVVGAHLSKVRILSGSERIEPGYPLRVPEE